ncbi:hypothetical protein [Streptosporangium sp. NPDC049644]|uniref:hypothetical protein n=1 Tax=Streptosporangium sp. NPDC049644 TaxID=3155507 RepID=UPI00341D8B40
MRAREVPEAGVAEHAARMDLPTEEDRRRERARIIEIAQTLLSGGLTIRRAAENLNVETFTLKAWLKEAGIQISCRVRAGVTGRDRGGQASSGECAERADPAGAYRGGRLDDGVVRPAATRLLATGTPVRGQGSGASKAAALPARLDAL